MNPPGSGTIEMVLVAEVGPPSHKLVEEAGPITNITPVPRVEPETKSVDDTASPMEGDAATEYRFCASATQLPDGNSKTNLPAPNASAAADVLEPESGISATAPLEANVGCDPDVNVPLFAGTLEPVMVNVADGPVADTKPDTST